MTAYPRSHARALGAVLLLSLLTACTAKEAIKTPVNIIGMLFGAVPPPEQTTVLQELTREYDICVGDGGGPECAQIAYANVRKAKGLDEKPLPEGIVIVRQDGETVVTQQPTP
ncbi:MAG TPA: hypothetical protein VFV64_07655 [Permianibacter sp.]|nr:hypothetical protein [Permianibacter sp.]